MNARAYRTQAAQHAAAATAREEAAARCYDRGQTAKAEAHNRESLRHVQAAAECLMQAERLERKTTNQLLWMNRLTA